MFKSLKVFHLIPAVFLTAAVFLLIDYFVLRKEFFSRPVEPEFSVESDSAAGQEQVPNKNEEAEKIAVQEPSAPKIVKATANRIILENQLVKYLFDVGPVVSPKAVAFSPDGQEIWVTRLMDQKIGVSVFDLAGEKIKNVKLPDGGGAEMAFSNDGKKAYVSQMETARVFEINAETKEILRVFKTDSAWTKVVSLSGNGKFLYASNWSGNNVSEIDLGTGKLFRQIAVVKTPRAIYLTGGDKYMYVAGFANGEIEKIDLAAGNGKIIYKTGGAMRHFSADENRKIVFVSDMAKNAIFQIDLETDKVKKFVDTDFNPNTIALSPDNKVLFVSCRGINSADGNYYIPGPEWGSVLLFDAETGQMLDAIIAGNQPTGLAVSPDGSLLVFSDFLDGKLEFYQIPDYQALKAGNGGASRVYKEHLRK